MWDILSSSFSPYFISPTVLLCFHGVFLSIIFTTLIALWIILFFRRKTQHRKKVNNEIIFGIFHPYCNAGGGGERVLWVSVNAILTRFPNNKIHIYTGDIGVSPREILDKAQTTFNIKIDINKVNFVYLRSRFFVEAKHYPYFTLLLQSLGSVVLGFESLWEVIPDIYIDTMGYAFTMPIFKYFGFSKTATYTHYPTITEDMMKRVKQRVSAHNNKGMIAKNPLFTRVKIIYYQMFGWLYGLVGRCADIVMVNSSWTEEHINKLWKIPLKTHRVYPPCEVEQLKSLNCLANEDGPIYIVSVGQFRPEKDHPMMLQTMYELRSLLTKNEPLWNRIKLIFVGSCRNDEDRERVKNLKDLSKYLSIEDNVQFKVNISYGELLNVYQTAVIGLHAMWNEHFGIGVVECMAAGLIMIAHRSGGPLSDIIETSEGSQTGFLAVHPEEYARTILGILSLSKEQRDSIKLAARASVNRFSQKEFEKGFLRAIDPLIKKN